jgi:hypothetical protein
LLVILWADCQEEVFSTISHIPNRRNYNPIKLKIELEKNNVCLIFMNILRPTKNSGVSCHWFPPKIFAILTWDMELPFPFSLFPSSPHDQFFMKCYLKFLFHFSGNYRLKGWVPWETTQAWSKEFLDPSSPSKGMPTLTSSNLNLKMLSAWLGKLKPKDWSSVKLERLIDRVEHWFQLGWYIWQIVCIMHFLSSTSPGLSKKNYTATIVKHLCGNNSDTKIKSYPS